MEISNIPDCLTDDQLSSLNSFMNPLEPCDVQGKGFYVATRQFIREITSSLNYTSLCEEIAFHFFSITLNDESDGNTYLGCYSLLTIFNLESMATLIIQALCL